MTKNVIDTKIQNNISEIRNNDIVFKIFFRRTRSISGIFMSLALVHMTIWAIVGVIVERFYQSKNFIGFLSLPEIILGPLLFGLLVPLVWIYYYWLPSGVLNSIGQLLENKVIYCRDDSEPLRDTNSDLADRLSSALCNPILPRLAAASTSIIVVLFYLVLIPSEMRTSGGMIVFWYAGWWPKHILGLIVSINTYIVCLYIFKVITVVLTLREYFNSEDITELFIYFPDGSNGMGAVGSLAIRIGQFAILIGIWVSWLVLFPVFLGGHINLLIGSLLLPVYLIISFFVLLSILAPAHNAMRRYKLNKLKLLGFQIEDILYRWSNEVEIQSQESINNDEELRRLRELYALASQLREWPITYPQLGRFSGVAFIPTLTGLLSLAFDITNILE
jgi:hypothetical protein